MMDEEIQTRSHPAPTRHILLIVKTVGEAQQGVQLS
jgi:hypothetical protein